MSIEHFVKGSDNVITLTLQENGIPVSGAWTALDIYIGSDGFNIHRTANGAGITFNSGVLQIRPSQLSEDMAPLPNGTHRVYIKVKDAVTNTVGAYFGASDSPDPLYFDVTDPPG